MKIQNASLVKNLKKPEEHATLFEEFIGNNEIPSLIGIGSPLRGTISPRIDVSETKKTVLVTAELPGLDEKDFELLVTPETLTIKGEKKIELEALNGDYSRTERVYGFFSRTISLPYGIDKDKAEATFKRGVLKITLPKTIQAQKKVKRLEIKTEDS